MAPASTDAVPESQPSEVAPLVETTDRVESFVDMMIRDMGNLPSLSPERGGLQRTEEEQGGQALSSPPRGPGRGVILSDEEVQELSPRTAHQDPSFGRGTRFEVLESSSNDGSTFFRPGYTLPPLCPGALE